MRNSWFLACGCDVKRGPKLSQDIQAIPVFACARCEHLDSSILCVQWESCLLNKLVDDGMDKAPLGCATSQETWSLRVKGISYISRV